MNNVTSCPQCGADNLHSASSCIDCGSVLDANPIVQVGAADQPALPSTPGSRGSRPVEIAIERSGKTVLEVTMDQGTILVGRADVDGDGHPVFPDVDLTDVDQDRLVSRRHLCLHIDDAGIQAEDLASGNGTYVEHVGKLKHHELTPVRPGARMMLGRGGLVLSVR